MSRQLPHRRYLTRRSSSRGFTLAETVVVVAVLTIIAGVLFQTTGRSLRREELNAFTVSLYGWLEEVQRKAMGVDPTLREANPEQYPTCRVTFNTGALRPGSVLAETPAFCAPTSPQQNGNAVFLLPSVNPQKNFVVQTFNGNAITFSPRGTVTFEGGSTPQNQPLPLTVEISREGGSVTRCLRVEPLLGFLAIGAANNQQSTDALNCPEGSFDGAF
jgi:prepilin-type N-terminal cleavage/methylation domain-containing protein